jgi:TonB family protein
MNLEARSVPGTPANFLNFCLVDGDPAQQHRWQKVRRRAILFSIFFQTIAVAALIIFPLLGKGERIPVRMFIERPPYRLGSDSPSTGAVAPVEPRVNRPCLFCKQPATPSRPITSSTNVSIANPADEPGLGSGLEGTPDGVPSGLPSEHRGPIPPRKPDQFTEETERLVIGHIDPAYILTRVEPAYPHLALQLHREGRVELRAIIATDGSIQSLEVLSGDPLFYQSALTAVREWRYHPTYLNNRPVEVDTHITVIYSLNR